MANRISISELQAAYIHGRHDALKPIIEKKIEDVKNPSIGKEEQIKLNLELCDLLLEYNSVLKEVIEKGE